MTTSPGSLADHLKANPGTHRSARLTICHDCQRPVVVGLDSDRAAFTARADPDPLTPRGEAHAQLNGLATYRAELHQNKVRLHKRTKTDITLNPAGTKKLFGHFDVLASHACGTQLPPGMCRDSRIGEAQNQKKAKHNDECPF